MKSLINYKDFKCNNCGDDYQGVHPYLHSVLGTVCIDCLDSNQNLTDSVWA